MLDVGLPLLLLTAFAVTFRFDLSQHSLPLVLVAVHLLLSGSGGIVWRHWTSEDLLQWVLC